MLERLGPYRLLRELGRGGMGVVYAAQDERLGRRVALKTIHEHLADPRLRERFWREARAAAALDHPHVCRLFEVGEAEGRLYLAMELLEGEPLSARLERGALPLEEVLRIGGEVLGALEALHGVGVVHRDLKPSNIFLTPGGVRLLDFGLALSLDAQEADASRLTQTGMLLGTPGFMAPEQWTGGPIGPQADIFAVAALLFEMVTGRPAFRGQTPVEIFHSIMHERPPALGGGPATEELDAVLQAAFARDPALRPATARAMADALAAVERRLRAPETPVVMRLERLLLLPFRLLRPDPELDFLPLGLVDALTASLTGLDGLVVKPGTEEQAELARRGALARLAELTHAQMALSGSLLRAGSRLRASAQLRRLPEGEVLWAQTLEADAADVFGLQDTLALRLVERLEVRWNSDRARRLQPDTPATARAYECYLRANQLAYTFGMLPAARDLYLACLAEDPRYAPAWARLGRIYRIQAKYGEIPADEGRRKAREAFERALELSPELAVAHYLYAHYEIEDLGRPKDALLRLLEQARRAPTTADLFAGLVVACRFVGLLDASMEADRRARRLDPGLRTSVPYTHWMRGEYAEALAQDFEDHTWMACYVPPMLGRPEQAVAACREREQRASQATAQAIFACTRAALEGDAAGARAALERAAAGGFRDPEGLYLLLRSLVRVGAGERALEGLEDIVARGFACPQPLERDPWLEPLRSEPRFVALLERARAAHQDALTAYRNAGGELLLGPGVRGG